MSERKFGNEFLFCRTVVLSASAFNSRHRFLEQLRRRFGGGTFNLAGNIATNTLADYYSSLKEDALSDPDRDKRVFFHSDHFGFQSGTYWILSPDVSIYEVNLIYDLKVNQ